MNKKQIYELLEEFLEFCSNTEPYLLPNLYTSPEDRVSLINGFVASQPLRGDAQSRWGQRGILLTDGAVFEPARPARSGAAWRFRPVAGRRGRRG